MCKEGICQIWNFGFLRSKRSNLEVWKKWGVNVEMSPYLRRYKYLVKEVYWWNVVYCMGVWEVAFNFWFLKIFIWFLGEAKVWVKKSFFIENLKNGDWAILLVDMWTLLWNNVWKFHFVKFVPFGCVLNKFPRCEYWVKKVRILTKKSDPNQSKPNQSEPNQSEPNQSKPNQSKQNQSNFPQITASSMELFFQWLSIF